MSDHTPDATTTSTPASGRKWPISAGILAVGMVVGGYLLGDGLVRAKDADRSVTVRGLAERNVTADLATWTISYSSTATDLQAAQADVDRDTKQIAAYFKNVGFPADAIQPTGINVSQYSDKGVLRYTVRQRQTLRSRDIERVQDAVKRQDELVRRGVVLEGGSDVSYSYTKLDEIKPEMVAEATKDARAAAEQFAEDSGAHVGAIRHATQGYFSINARDGDSSGWGAGESPFKKVRVVTTVDFSLD